MVPWLTRRDEDVSEKVLRGDLRRGVVTRKNVTRMLRKLHTEELQDMYHSQNNIGMSRTTLVQHAARVIAGN